MTKPKYFWVFIPYIYLLSEELNAKRNGVKNNKLIETKNRNKNKYSVIIQSNKFMPLLLEQINMFLLCSPLDNGAKMSLKCSPDMKLKVK